MKTIATVIASLLLGGLFASSPAAADGGKIGPRILAVGDSITYGVGTYDPDRYSWPVRIGAERAAVPSGCLVTRCNKKRPALATYGRTVMPLDPDVVIVAYGMNDLVWSTPREIVDGLEDVKARNDRRGVVTYVATLTPIGDRIFGLNHYRTRVNTLIRREFESERVIDFDAALISPVGDLPDRYDSGDNLHPNARAYKVMAKVAAQALLN